LLYSSLLEFSLFKFSRAENPGSIVYAGAASFCTAVDYLRDLVLLGIIACGTGLGFYLLSDYLSNNVSSSSSSRGPKNFFRIVIVSFLFGPLGSVSTYLSFGVSV